MTPDGNRVAHTVQVISLECTSTSAFVSVNLPKLELTATGCFWEIAWTASVWCTTSILNIIRTCTVTEFRLVKNPQVFVVFHWKDRRTALSSVSTSMSCSLLTGIYLKISQRRKLPGNTWPYISYQVDRSILEVTATDWLSFQDPTRPGVQRDKFRLNIVRKSELCSDNSKYIYISRKAHRLWLYQWHWVMSG